MLAYSICWPILCWKAAHPHRIPLRQNVASYKTCDTACDTMLRYHTIPHYPIADVIIPYHPTLCYTIPYYPTLSCTMLYYTTHPAVEKARLRRSSATPVVGSSLLASLLVPQAAPTS